MLARVAIDVRRAATREDLLRVVVRDVRDGFAIDRVAIYGIATRSARHATTLAVAGSLPGEIPASFTLADGWVGAALNANRLVRIEALRPAPDDAELRTLGIAAVVIVPIGVDDIPELAIALESATPRVFEESELVALRCVATHVDYALDRLRHAEHERLRRRRGDGLERTMLALREPREPRDILAILARGLAHDFRRPCVAYEALGGGYVAVAGSGVDGPRPEIALDRFEFELLAGGTIRRDAGRDVVGIAIDANLHALVVLENAREPLDEDDERYLRAIATHAALALSGAFAFRQLLRYASEGAALKEAARTILGYTELRPLATALARLAIRLARARDAAILAVEDDRLVTLGAASQGGDAGVGDVALAGADPAEVLRARHATQAALVAPLDLGGDARHGYLVVCREREHPFERFERRIFEALVNLAKLAIRNVDLFERQDRANRALAESNGFKDDLLAMFAHDFKGPLTVISGFGELLLEMSDDPEIRGNVTTIVDQTHRLGKLAEDALALAATQSAGFSLRRERDDFTAFIRSCCAVLDRDGSRIVVDAPEEPVETAYDASRLRHVIDNVVGNALKYSSGPVGVRVDASADGGATLTVTDRGIGIPVAELETIFARYGRASNARSRGVSGSGVGLYIAKKIVEVHGGTLAVASTENVGSRFTVRLPG